MRRLAEAIRLPAAERDAFFAAGQGPDVEPFQPAPSPVIAPNDTPTTPGASLIFPHSSNNLPDEPNRLVGREREMAEISELLRRPEVQVLTITGPGGTRKTRLVMKPCK